MAGGNATIRYTVTDSNGCITVASTVVPVTGLVVVAPITGIATVEILAVGGGGGSGASAAGTIGGAGGGGSGSTTGSAGGTVSGSGGAGFGGSGRGYGEGGQRGFKSPAPNGGGGAAGGAFGAGGGGASTNTTGGSAGGPGGGGGGGGAGGGGGGFGNNGGVAGSGGQGGAFGGTGGTGGFLSGNAAGGGGAGIGGAIFAAQGSTIQLGDGTTIGPGVVNTNVIGGAAGVNSAGGTAPTAGSAVGPDIFLFKAASLSITGSSNQNIGAIDADSNATVGNFDAGVTLNMGTSTGVTTFNGASYTYKGGTTITQGTLKLSTQPLATTGNVSIAANGGLFQNVNTVNTSGTFTNSGALIIGATFNRAHYTSFTSTGAVYMVGASGTISNGALSGTVFSVGRDPTETTVTPANTFSTTSTLNYTSINIYTNSSISNSAATTGNVYISGTGASINFSGGATGSIFTVGQDSFSTVDNATNYTTTSAITGWPTVNIATGTVNANNNITASTAFTTGANATVNVAATISGSGTGTFSNAGTMVFTTAFSAANFSGTPTNAVGAKMSFNGVTFTSNASFTNNGTVYVYNPSASISGALTTGSGTLNIGSDIAGTLFATTNYTTNAAITQPTINVNAGTFGINNAVTAGSAFAVATNTTVNVAASLSGSSTGTFSNAGTMTFTSAFSSANFAGTPTNAAAGKMNFSGITFTSNASFTNNGNVYIYNAGSALSGALTTGSGTLNIGVNSAATTFPTTNLTANSAITQPNINISAGTFTAGANINASTALVIASGTTAAFNASLQGGTLNNSSASTSIGATGSFAMTGAITNSGTITNNGSMILVQGVTGAGSIINSATGTLQLQSGANVAQALTNQASGHVTVVNSAQTSTVTNHGTMTINSGVNLTSGAITTDGVVNLSGDISMPGATFANTGTVNISGARNVTATAYNSADSQNFTITNMSTFDQLNVVGNVDVSNDVINISSSYNNTSHTWSIITATGTLTYNGLTQVNLPVSSNPLYSWTYNFAPNALQVFFNSVTFSAYAGINAAIAGVINAMSNGSTTSGQQALIDALSACTTEAQYNQLLHEFMPSNNANAINIGLQNAVLNKISARVSGRRELFASEMTGFASGDISPNLAMWTTVFGSIARQNPNTQLFNEGYRAKSAGLLIGMDTLSDGINVYGIAAGYSYTRVEEYSNAQFNTNINSGHALIYGANSLAGDVFLEWMLNGAYGTNNGSRYVNVGTGNLSVTSNYNSGLAGVRANFGKFIDINEIFRITQLFSLDYTYLYRPDYTESGSVAALHVANSANTNLLTLGTGFRLSIPGDVPWLSGSREARVMVSYDAINPGDAVTANFVVGSQNFIVTSHTARLALTLGADLALNLCDNLNLECSYDVQIRTAYLDNSATLKLKYFF